MRTVILSLLLAVTAYGQSSQTPIYNGVLQSDLTAAGFKINGANLVDYAGTNMTWNVVTGKFDATGGGGGTPGGSNTQVQYNNSGAFGGVPTLTYDGTNTAFDLITGGGAAKIRVKSNSGTDGFLQDAYSNLSLSTNAYYNASNWVYDGSAPASLFLTGAGTISALVAPLGIPSNVVSWKYAFNVLNNGQIGIADGSDLAIGRNAAGVLEVNNGTAGTYRDLRLRDITIDGIVTGNRLVINSSNNPFSIGGASTVAGAGDLAIGYGAAATGQSTVIGYGATATVSNNVLIGFTATGAGNSVAVGYGANAAPLSFALGSGAAASGVGSIAMGYGSSAPGVNQFVSGSSGSSIDNVYFGKGYTHATPTLWTLNGTGGSGTNIAGGDIAISGGAGTGTGVGGSILFKTAPVGTTGTVLNTPATKLTISPTATTFASGSTVNFTGATVTGLPGGGGAGGSTTQVQYNNAGALAGSANMVWDNAIPKLTLSGGATSDSRLVLGTLEFQPYGLNNSWFGENVYFDGGGFRYRAAGKAGMFYFFGDEGQFRFFPTGTAGNAIPGSATMKVHQNGSFAMGSGLAQAAADFTGSLLYFNPTSTNLRVASAYGYAWSSTTDAAGTVDTGLSRNTGGVVEVNNGTTGTYRDLKADELNAVTGFQVNGAATANYELTGNGTDFVSKASDIPNGSSAQQTGFSSNTYLAGSVITLAAGDFKVGSTYRCMFDMTKTTAGTAAPVITIYIGTLGSTSDTAAQTITFAVATGVADTGMFEVWVNFRAVGASATISSVGRCVHNLAVTGLTTTGASGSGTVSNSTSSTFNSTAMTKIGVAFNGGASYVGTNNLVQAYYSNP